MRDMNKFDAIRYFCIAAETLSFRETAHRLGISPSVISRVIHELERELGEPLFQRNTRSINLTRFGEQFLPKARQWLKDSDQLFLTTRQKDEMVGLVRVTVPAWREMDAVIAELLQALENYPQLSVDWRADMDKLNVVAHRIDIGLRVGPEPDPNFIVRTITQVRDRIVVAPSLVERLGEPDSLEDLCERYPFAVPVKPGTGRTWTMTLDESTTLVPRHTRLFSADVYSALQAVLQGQAVGLLSDFLCRPHVQAGRLCVLLPDTPIQAWPLFLYRPYQTVTPARVLKVFDVLTDILRRKFGAESG